ncbi:MAG: trypsin-like serine protease [Actinomycetales bacterium]|nr:trypsin-like serine protease [Actinomycetales bacterium]
MIMFYEGGGRYRCTATLVTPTVLLTAAHCTMGTAGKTLVTFDSVIAEAPPSGIPAAADPAAGYVSSDVTKDPTRTWYAGQSAYHPQYSDFTDMDNWNDVGVVVLDTPVTGVTPSKIAPLNYLDRFAQPKLNSTLFTIVGYGTEVRMIVTVTSYGYTQNCRYLDGLQRVDIKGVQSWLMGYGVMP